jgi:transposase
MLPASDLTEILTNLAALNLQPSTAAAVLGAVLAPLLRSSDPNPPVQQRQRVVQPRAKPRQAARQKRKYQRGAPDARDRAHAALKANPGMSWTKVAAIAGVSRSTVANAARGAEASKARKASAAPEAKTEARARAVRFLKDALAHGPQRVSDVEEAAAKARVDPQALAQARAELGVVVSRGNAGGVQAVQWGLPSPAGSSLTVGR